MAKKTGGIFGTEFEMGPSYSHGANILKKAADQLSKGGGKHEVLIRAVAQRYVDWRRAATVPPSKDELANDWRGFVKRQTQLFEPYRASLDTGEVDQAFDSRGALQPSALEEFCTYLFQPLVQSLGGDVELGKREVFHGLYFSSADFASFSVLPEPRYQGASVDFVICKRLGSMFSSRKHKHEYEIFVPVVAVECKTYLDRPRWFASEILADNLKRGFPYVRQYVIAETLKLDTTKVNIAGSRMDHVYVLRRTENVDRKKRRADEKDQPPIHGEAVFGFFDSVRRHLTTPWEPLQGWKETGILK